MRPRSTARRAALNVLALALGSTAWAVPQGDRPGAAPGAVGGEVVLGDPFAPLPFGDDADHAWTAPFVPGARYSDAITAPEAYLGQPVGSRLAAHDEILWLMRRWAQQSPRMTLESYGVSYEGRELVRAIVTSPANHTRLDAIRAGVRRLADPRGLTDSDAERLLADLPGVAWMGYGIHGDETSASEAAVPVVYHLVAAEGPEFERLLDELVIVVDPCLNPDGRERIRSMVVQSAGRRANLDHAAMQRGRWPHGRGNHYLFDMNRDWMAGEAPETRARWRALLDLPPQLFVDAHEMSGLDTFLFYPQSSPKNPHLPATLGAWQSRFADDAARAFDQYAWGYYTREWADAWAPIYSDAWGSLTGAIGILYEQGRTIGAPLRRQSGEVVAYRESVHGQVAVSLANLESFRAHRAAIQRDWLAHRRAACAPPEPWAGRSFAVVPGSDPERHARLLRTLVGQGIEVMRATREFTASAVVGALGEKADTRAFPAGTWLVAAAQPQGALVRAYLDFDPRIDAETLREERENLERGKDSKLYDITAWDLGRQYGVDAWWLTAPSDVPQEPLRELRAWSGPVTDPTGAYAWLLDGDDTRSVATVARMLELGLAVHMSDRDFTATVAEAGGASVLRAFPRGSFVLRRHENRAAPDDVDALVARAVRERGGVLWSAATGRSVDEGPDLGGRHFHLLVAPRVALLSNTPVSTTDFGALWRHLDEDLGLHTTLVDCQSFGGQDLRRFNVLVVPEGATRALRSHADKLRTWVQAGGTLVALGGAATDLTREPFELSSNVLRPDALEDLDAYRFLAVRERSALAVQVDAEALYGPVVPQQKPSAEKAQEGEKKGDEKDGDGKPKADPDAAREDAWKARFSPAGAILAADAHPDAWITAGVGALLAVEHSGDDVWLTTGTPAVRLATEERLRLGGLLWPEARERIAGSAWLTVERRGAGQVIAFRGHPVFRGSWRGTARLFSNAVVVGPGMGTDAVFVR